MLFNKLRKFVARREKEGGDNTLGDFDRESFFENYRLNGAKIAELSQKFSYKRENEADKLRESEEFQKSRSRDQRLKIKKQQQ